VISEQEFETLVAEAGEAQRYWQSEMDRPRELRDNDSRMQSGLEYLTALLSSFQARLPLLDQTYDELDALPEEQHRWVLKERQTIIRALCDEVKLGADGRVEVCPTRRQRGRTVRVTSFVNLVHILIVIGIFQNRKAARSCNTQAEPTA
jgi:hypothetical protein